MGDPPGDSAVYRSSEPGILTADCIRIRVARDVLPEFVAYAFETKSVQRQMEGITRGVAQRKVSLARFRECIRVPLPPLDHQRRIVEILEDHLSRLDAADAELHRARNRRPLMLESFLLKHRSIRSADHRRLGELLAEPLVNGRSVPDGDGFPVLRLTCLSSDGRVDLTQRKLGSWSGSEAAAHVVTKGDLFVARGNGSLRLVGRAGLVDEEPLKPVAFPDTLIRVRARQEIMSNAFLCLIWTGVNVRRQVEGLARTTAGSYKINQKHLQEVTLPCPDVTTQSAVVEETTWLLDSSSRIEASIDMAIARGERLRRALLAAAFAGRLTGRPGDDQVVVEMASV